MHAWNRLVRRLGINSMMRRSLRTQRLATAIGGMWLAVIMLSTSGCAWYEQFQKGPAFGGYDESAGGSMRGKNPEAKSSGFLYDERSKKIERNLGGF
jgi:hypothetical protein